jgi:hypothetical protein
MSATAHVKPHDLPADSRRRVVARIRKETRLNEAGAQRLLDGALQFLDLCGAMSRGEVESFRAPPSPVVDHAWHAFILHTPEYMAYCEEHCGGYVHHAPTDPDDPSESGAGDLYERTRQAIRERFGELDELLWPDLSA